MFKRFGRIVILLSAVLVCACKTAQKREEAYIPSEQTIAIKSDVPVVRLWDRWEENESDYLLAGSKNIIAEQDLTKLLADDPHPDVSAKMKSFRKWDAVGRLGMTFGFLAAALAGIGYIHDKDGERSFSIPVINAFWVISGVGISTGTVGYVMREKRFEELISIHNGRIWDKEKRSAYLAVEVPF